MKIDEIRELLNRAPFQPFTIYAAGAEPSHIAHPDFVALSPNGRTIVVYPTHSKSHRLIDVPLISQIEVEGQHPDAFS